MKSKVLQAAVLFSFALGVSACMNRTNQVANEIIFPTETFFPCTARVNFGDPADSPYVLPYPVGKSYRISQSYCDPEGSHHIQQAYDFVMPVGVEVTAARAGLVIEVREDTPDICDWEYMNRHNYLLIEHKDGTVAFYAHLKQNGVLVEVGDHVEQGQRIATSGNSGFTGFRPHLHFGVYQFYPLREEYDVSVNFSNTDGPLDERGGLIQWRYYEALPYN